MSIDYKIGKKNYRTLELISDFIDDVTSLCDSEVGKYFISSVINNLFKSKFMPRPSLYYTGLNNHNWDFDDFDRILDEKSGPFFEPNEIEEYIKDGYVEFGCDYFKTIGVKFVDKEVLIEGSGSRKTTVYKIFPRYSIDENKIDFIDFAIFCVRYDDDKVIGSTKIALFCSDCAESPLSNKQNQLEDDNWLVYRIRTDQVMSFHDESKVDKLFLDIRMLADGKAISGFGVSC